MVAMNDEPVGDETGMSWGGGGRVMQIGECHSRSRETMSLRRRSKSAACASVMG